MMKIVTAAGKSGESGVSLVELSMVLAIISIIISSVMVAGYSQTEAAKKIQTEMKLDTIEKSLVAFMAINRRLPCPADAAKASTDALAGDENCTGTASVVLGAFPAGYVSTVAGAPRNTVIGGSVPFNALQLPKEFMLDGWGNKFTYAVSKAFTASSVNNTNMGLITLQDATLANRTDQAVLVLISHGVNGYGAWPSSGVAQKAASANAAEIENGDLVAGWDAVFVAQEIIPAFDDIVRYKMKWHLVREAGATIAEPACDTARTVISTTPNKYCDGTTYPSLDPDCATYLGALAIKVNELCLQ